METECASCEVRTGLYVLLQVSSISQLTVSRLSRQCGILNISQPYMPPLPVTGIGSLCFYITKNCVISTQESALSQYSLFILTITRSRCSPVANPKSGPDYSVFITKYIFFFSNFPYAANVFARPLRGFRVSQGVLVPQASPMYRMKTKLPSRNVRITM
jgi:hypothetical protein